MNELTSPHTTIGIQPTGLPRRALLTIRTVLCFGFLMGLVLLATGLASEQLRAVPETPAFMTIVAIEVAAFLFFLAWAFAPYHKQVTMYPSLLPVSVIWLSLVLVVSLSFLPAVVSAIISFNLIIIGPIVFWLIRAGRKYFAQ